MSESSPSFQPDVVVAGGGVVGASTARELADAGARVLLVDRDREPGAGSRAAAGVGVPSVRLLDDPAMLDFALRGQRVLAEDLKRLSAGGRTLALHCGLLRPVPDSAEAERLTALAAEHPDFLGDWLGADQLAEREPHCRRPYHGAFLDDDAVVVDAPAYVDALVDEARQAGVTVRTGCELREVAVDERGVTLTLNDERTRTEALVLACGAWAGSLRGLDPLPVRPVRGQMLRVTPDDPAQRPRHIVSGPLYLAPAPDGRSVLAGATEEDAAFTPGPTVEGALMLLAHIARHWPGLRGAQLSRIWYGYRAATPDGRPLLGRLPGTARVVVAGGHGGQGILTGARTGHLAAALVRGEQPEELAHFDPARDLP